eukprot:m51a1_g2038 putative n-acetyltransferase esco2-like isoform x1 (310) ;mRNA; r:1343941-1345388
MITYQRRKKAVAAEPSAPVAPAASAAGEMPPAKRARVGGHEGGAGGDGGDGGDGRRSAASAADERGHKEGARGAGQKKGKERPRHVQLFLDLGQKSAGSLSTTCPVCGLTYSQGTEDDALHAKIHRKALRDTAPITFSGWRERGNVVAEYHALGSGVIAASSAEFRLRSLGRLFYEVRCQALKELGAGADVAAAAAGVAGADDAVPGERVYLYLDSSNRAVGCAVIEPCPRNESSAGEPIEAPCGVSRIWVHRSARRQGVATRLLDAVRTDFCYGRVLARDELAFSQPTAMGRALFERYTQLPSFLAYS